MFREGANKKGLTFFSFIVIAILVYLAWQSGGAITEKETIVIEPIQNYHAKISYDSITYDIWRFDNFLKFQIDDQIQFYYDSAMDSLRVYNQERLITSTSKINDFIIRYDPYLVVEELKDGLSYESTDNTGRYEVELYGDGSSIYLNEYDLPDSIMFDSSGIKIQYMYLNIGNVELGEALPQEIENEDQI